MTVEAPKPADTDSNISYIHFAEQIDPETGEFVGLVPMIPSFESPGSVSLGYNCRVLEIGAGLGHSFDFVLRKTQTTRRGVLPTVSGVLTDPFNSLKRELEEKFRRDIGAFAFYQMGALESADTFAGGSDLVIMANMIHLVEKDELEDLVTVLGERLDEGKEVLVSTTFIREWQYNKAVTDFHNSMTMAVSLDAFRRKLITREDLRGAELEERPAEYYIELFARRGFEVRFPDGKPYHLMPCTVKSYDLIGHDPDWLKRSLPNVEPQLAQEIIHSAVVRVMERNNLQSDSPLPRNTLVFVARRVSNIP